MPTYPTVTGRRVCRLQPRVNTAAMYSETVGNGPVASSSSQQLALARRAWWQHIRLLAQFS